MDIYQMHIMDHYRTPRCKGICENATFTSDVVNPSCGDSVTITGVIQDSVVTCVRFEGKGCVISQAATSMLLEKIQGMQTCAVLALKPEYMMQLIGINLGPTRARCALLALEALHKGVQSRA